MQSASRAANAAIAEVRQVGVAVVSALPLAIAHAVEASLQHAFVDIAAPARTALEADIAQMQGTAAELAKKGGRIKLDNCGGRLCVAVNTDPGQSRVN